MKKNIYTSIKDLAQLTQFIFTSQSMYTKASPQVIGFLLSTYFDDSSRLLTITDNDEKILACATLTFPERYPEVAFLGNYELPVNTLNRSAIKKELFSLIENVAKENHITKIIGPINFNTWLGNRFKTSTTNKDYAWEPLNPKEYVDDFTSEDFSKDMEYITNYYKDSNRLFATTEEKYKKCINEGYSFREINLENNEDIKKLYQLSLDCFDQNYCYTPISFDQHLKSHVNPLRATDLSNSAIICKDGHDIGFFYTFIDDKKVIIKTILIDPKIRNAGLASAMVYESIRRGKEKGVTEFIGALVRRGNASEYFFKSLGLPDSQHQYHLFSKSL